VTSQAQNHVAFYLTGRTAGPGQGGIEGLGLLPALLARYRDLAALRHDFPLVLLGPGADPVVLSLSELFDDIVGGLAGEPAAGRLTHHARRLEHAIRARVAGGTAGTLSSLWDEAARALATGADAALADDLDRLRTALVDGEVVGCDRGLPARLLTHAWRSAQEAKARSMRKTIDRLVLQLSEILIADEEHSAAGMSPDRLRASVGTGFAAEFDFDAMSGLLTRTRAKTSQSDERRRRIRRLLATLESLEFFPARAATGTPGTDGDLAFRSCAAALEAYRERLPRMAGVAKAVVLAGLEVEGEYRDGEHDAVFEALGAADLEKELAAFPDILVRLDADRMEAAEGAVLMEVLAQGLPLKVLLQTDDVAAFAPVADARAPASVSVRQVANAAIGAGGVFVLQSACSHLYRAREGIVRGMGFAGPALFTVYSGAGAAANGVPEYLMAAAAMESRAFPAFVFDPSAGADWASRFRLEDNPQPQADWPIRRLDYEDESLQRVSHDVAFTVVDFLACHEEYAEHFSRVPPDSWNGHMIPVHESVADEREPLDDRVPYLLMVGPDDALHRVLVDRRLVRAARRCRDQWRSLQELGGIHNSHAERLLAREKQAWEEQARREAESRLGEPAVAQAAAPALAAAPAGVAEARPAVAETPPAVRSDEPRIETARCSSCNECTKINSRMFQYDGNKQAHIVDLKAGTYAQMVQAAESCQVAVIHPGKPWNPDEPGLAELIERAERFG